MTPVLAIDVDGVLNPDLSAKRRRSLAYHDGWLNRWADTPQGRYRLFVNPVYGRWLRMFARETGAELVWASTWEDNANIWLCPLLKLDPLPVIPVRAAVEAGERMKPKVESGICKLPVITEWMAGRRLAWLEDSPVADARVDIGGQFGGTGLVIQVDEKTGLEQRHLELARRWLAP